MTVAPAVLPVAVERDRPGWRAMVGFLLIASALVFLAKTTVLPETEFATVWPSAGDTVLWLLVRRAALVSIDTAVMFAAMLAGGLVTGIPVWMAVALAVTHTMQSLIVVTLLRRF